MGVSRGEKKGRAGTQRVFKLQMEVQILAKMESWSLLLFYTRTPGSHALSTSQLKDGSAAPASRGKTPPSKHAHSLAL